MIMLVRPLSRRLRPGAFGVRYTGPIQGGGTATQAKQRADAFAEMFKDDEGFHVAVDQVKNGHEVPGSPRK
jgi:hypothetical protein